MHFHLPKPLHGWRDFAGEVGIIVVGVLIALGAEQVVQSLHERAAVQQVRNAVIAELSEDRARWEYLRNQDNCIDTRLKALDRWATTGPAQSTIAYFERPNLWSVHSSAWELAKSSTVAERLPLKERLSLSFSYDIMSRFERYLIDEDQDWKTINVLAATALSAQNRAELSKAIAAARYDVQRRRLSYDILFEKLNTLGIHADANAVRALGSPQGLCTPLNS